MTATFKTCVWNATSIGTGSFVAASAVSGYQLPSALNVVDGGTYRYFATDGTLTENGTGVWTAASSTLTRAPANGTSLTEFTGVPIVTMYPSPLPLELPTAPAVVLPGFLFGCTLSTAGLSVSFAVSAGQAANSTGTDLMVLASSLTKSTGAWAVGSGNGALDTGTIAASTWYHVFLIKRTDTGVVDVLVSLSATAPSLPTNYTEFRRIGSMFVDGSNHWLKFVQLGDEFIWDVPLLDVNATALTTTSALFSLTVPSGLNLIANFIAQYTSTVAADFYVVQSPLITTQAANTPAGNFDDYIQIANFFQGMRHRIITDTSSRIRAVGRGMGTSQFSIVTTGWIDTRGRLY